MQKLISISRYNEDNHVFTDDIWKDNARVVIKYIRKTKKIEIAANREGFLSLASLFASIAEANFSSIDEIFLDSQKSSLCGELDKGSDDVMIYKLNS